MKHILLVLLLCTSLCGEDWSLKDKDLGWNSRELVNLYFHNSELQTQWAWEALSHYHVKGNETILDFGSGDGKLSALLSFMAPKGNVVGVDLSSEMVSYATKMFPYKNLLFQESADIDFSQVTFPEKFDLVTAFCVFHLIPNPSTVLTNINAEMKPGGHLVMTLPIGKNPDFFRAVSDEMSARGWQMPAPTSGSLQMRDSQQMHQVVSDAGFDVTHFEVVESRFPFSSKAEMIDWFEGTLAANWNIPKEDRREFCCSLANRYLTIRPDEVDPDGFVYFSLKRIDLVATSRK